ncbi:unnamed protein product [Penicillium salamii]|nr:unnamed protein product [Penicillium salamii]
MQKTRTINSALGARPFSAPRVQLQFQRNLQDVAITRTGKPLVKVQGGRSSIGGHTATVFGATGFLGRYIVNKLARQGCTVVVPYREEMAKRHLKVTGDLGRVVFMEYDLRNTQSIEESVRHSDVVYNLVGRQYPTKNFTYEDVHVDGVERIADAVAKYDVDRFIHVSSYNARRDSPSEYFATKAWGEEIVRNIYPETTIVRPAPMFGFEDNLLHKLAKVGNVFTANHMQERYWPVHAIDVGTALERMLHDDSTAGQTYELYGPKNYSTAEIAELVDSEIIKKRRHINVPKALLKPFAHYINKYLWWHTMSADEVEREFIDQVIDPEAKTFKDLGMEETADLANLTFHYLQGYRSASYYDLPPSTERERQEDKRYLHVLDDQHTMSAPILLLKTKSSPQDGYEEFFTSKNYTPTFVPVLEHRFHKQNLAEVQHLFNSGAFTTTQDHVKKYGGLIFTSQRAVEGFASMIENADVFNVPSDPLVLYTVGPATARTLTTLRDKHLPHATIYGADAGTGANLAQMMLEHYNGLYPGAEKPGLLFLVGEVRRDIIPKTLMDKSLGRRG